MLHCVEFWRTSKRYTPHRMLGRGSCGGLHADGAVGAAGTPVEEGAQVVGQGRDLVVLRLVQQLAPHHLAVRQRPLLDSAVSQEIEDVAEVGAVTVDEVAAVWLLAQAVSPAGRKIKDFYKIIVKDN